MPTRPSPHTPQNPRTGAYAQLDQWLISRRKQVVGAIVTAALVFRVFTFLELAASPCFWLHEWNQTDMNTFHNWALTIAEGDRWSRTVRPPLHGWHRAIADDYARLYPQRWAELQAASPDGDPDGPARALWDRWCGGGRTYQGPLYPYLIAGIYHLLGPAVGWIYAVQMAVGVASIALVHVLSRRYFDDVAALAAALLMLLYGPLLFYEFVLLRATLIVFFGLLLVFLLDRAAERRTAQSWLGVGVALGLAVALKAHFILMLFAAIAWLLWHDARPWGRLAGAAAALLIGLLISFSPVVVRNVVAGAPPLAVDSNGPVTFLVSNAREAEPTSWGTDRAAGILAETESAFFPTVIAALGTHPDLASYAQLVLSKLVSTCGSFEAPNNVNFYYGRLHSRLLQCLPISFGLIGPPGLVGIALAWGRWRRCFPLGALILVNLAVVLVFFAFGRFRLPLAAALTPFAGYALARLAGFILARRWAAATITLLAGGLPAILISPTSGDEPRVRSTDVKVGYQVYYDILLQSALARGDLAAAADVLGESLDRQPPEVAALGPAHPARTVLQAEFAAFYAEIHQRLAYVLDRAGRIEEARRGLERAAELAQAADRFAREAAQPATSPPADHPGRD